LRYIEFLLPGLIGLNLMNSSLWGVAYTIVLDRKRRLLKQMAATPMRRGDFMAAHLLSRLVLLALEVASLVLVGWLFFDVVVRGSWAALLVVTLLGATAFGGIALVIAARRSEPDEANGWMNAVMLPMWLLSGSFFSYERFPDWLLPINRLLPLTALNDALRAVMTAGEPLARQAPELLVLAAWGLGGFLWARWRFQWQ
jgi:ABC-type multidrug transport system permease subunit